MSLYNHKSVEKKWKEQVSSFVETTEYSGAAFEMAAGDDKENEAAGAILVVVPDVEEEEWHVGHVRGLIAAQTMARFLTQQQAGSKSEKVHLVITNEQNLKDLYDQNLLAVFTDIRKLVKQERLFDENRVRAERMQAVGRFTDIYGFEMSRVTDNALYVKDMVSDYGADALNLYELYTGPLSQDSEWNEDGIEGIRRFLKRVYRLYSTFAEENLGWVPKASENDEHGKPIVKVISSNEMDACLYRVTKAVQERMSQWQFNTAVSSLMQGFKEIAAISKKQGGIDKKTLTGFAKILFPVAPHFVMELFEMLSISDEEGVLSWPELQEPDKMPLTIPVKEGDKVIGRLQITKGMTESAVVNLAGEQEGRIAEALAIAKRVIYVKDRILILIR